MKADQLGMGRRRVLILALAQGVLGDLLLRPGPWGVGFMLWALAGVGGLAWVLRQQGDALPREAWGWMAAAWGCGALFAGRAAEFLAGLTLIGGVGCLIMAAWSARGGRPFRAGVMDHVMHALWTGVHALLGGIGFLFLIARPEGAEASRSTDAPARTWVRVAIGCVVALPLLAVFGSLFAAADPVFERGLRSIFAFDFETVIGHGLTIVAWGWVTLGYVQRVVWREAGGTAEEMSVTLRPPRRPPVIETLTALSLLGLLFLVFVLVQLRYLFGDDEWVRSTVGLTYAEYARRGFFELIAVVALLLPVVLLADWVLRGHSVRQRGFDALVIGLLVLLGAILASAAKRLGLYTEAYGLTIPRFYAAAAMVWLGFVAVWLGATVLRGRRERFAGGTAVAALAVLLGLHGISPDAYIARHNLDRVARGLPFDVEHARQLGADAVPVLVRGLGLLSVDQARDLRAGIEKRWGGASKDWRSWNLGRHRARNAVREAFPTAASSEAQGMN